ncbi:MAG: hypothetical protein ACLQVL_15465 [Terriglobia bacterium]
MASGEWVTDYVQSRASSEHKEHEGVELRSSELAQIRAPGFFQLLINRVASDVRAFNSYKGNGRIVFQILSESPDGGFAKWTGFFVAQRERYPFIGLTVKLRDIFIDYERTIVADKNQKETVRGVFRIFAAPQGHVHTVLDGEPYCDVAEISEVLLRPVFDCVDFNTLGW